MKIFKSYGFWTALAGAVVILINALGDLFGFKIESKLVENVIMAVAGVLVALGVVSMGEKKEQEGQIVDNEESLSCEEQTQDESVIINDASKESEGDMEEKAGKMSADNSSTEQDN